uniref:Uncharacterized protein n=1 Tax=Arundo donax TaxID=35708 RepID=A0A0A9CZY6_ARUDO
MQTFGLCLQGVSWHAYQERGHLERANWRLCAVRQNGRSFQSFQGHAGSRRTLLSLSNICCKRP